MFSLKLDLSSFRFNYTAVGEQLVAYSNMFTVVKSGEGFLQSSHETDFLTLTKHYIHYFRSHIGPK